MHKDDDGTNMMIARAQNNFFIEDPFFIALIFLHYTLLNIAYDAIESFLMFTIKFFTIKSKSCVYLMKNRVIVTLLFIIIIFFSSRFFSFDGISAIGTISSCFLYPVLRFQQTIIEPFQYWLRQRQTVAELEKNCEDLKKERDDFLAQNIALKGMHHYSHETADVHRFNKRYKPENGHNAQILAKHFSLNNHFFLVAAGSAQGIKKDMVAIYANCLIGKVTDVYPWYCKVCLITDAECKVAAFCSKTKATGILEGMNDAQHMVLRHVSHLEKVETTDSLLSSGEGLIFPNGFALGVIESVARGDLFYSVYIKTVLDFSSLRYCTLIAKGDIEF